MQLIEHNPRVNYVWKMLCSTNTVEIRILDFFWLLLCSTNTGLPVEIRISQTNSPPWFSSTNIILDN